MKTKKCSKCNKKKELGDFNKRSLSKDGLRSECRICHRKRGLDYYYKNSEKRKAYDRMYNEKNKAKKKAYREKYKTRNPDKIKRSMNNSTKKYLQNNPEKYEAYKKVYCAKKSGQLIIEPCRICGVYEDIMAHHVNYNRPLDIKWLCRNCHINEHKKLRYRGHER